ncbi:Rieske 2Fe-2S domain-containing protein [bacterium]|nr:Rieske 2Fe-2S domain-containing protein [bacterium]
MGEDEKGSTEELPQSLPVDSRRKFLGRAAGALAACTGAGALAPALVAILSPLEGGTVVMGGDGRLDLGPLDAYESGVPKKVAVRGQRTDAFMKFGERALGQVIVIREGERFSCFSATCPHAGCDVGVSADSKLVCPCHDSRFENDGHVTGGPAPRGLDSLACDVKDGRVRVVFERFQVGVAEKRAI